ASYILRTLERRGYLRREAESGRYRLGLQILSLGGDAQANLDIADVALPFMRALVEKIHMTVHLAVLDQGEAVYIEKVEAPGFFRVNTWVGRRMFLHSTSVGKCLLAWLPKHDVETLVKQQGLKKRTPKTITTMTRLLAELEHVKQEGYAVDDEENSLGARCLGAKQGCRYFAEPAIWNCPPRPSCFSPKTHWGLGSRANSLDFCPLRCPRPLPA